MHCNVSLPIHSQHSLFLCMSKYLGRLGRLNVQVEYAPTDLEPQMGGWSQFEYATEYAETGGITSLFKYLPRREPFTQININIG